MPEGRQVEQDNLQQSQEKSPEQDDIKDTYITDPESAYDMAIKEDPWHVAEKKFGEKVAQQYLDAANKLNTEAERHFLDSLAANATSDIRGMESSRRKEWYEKADKYRDKAVRQYNEEGRAFTEDHIESRAKLNFNQELDNICRELEVESQRLYNDALQCIRDAEQLRRAASATSELARGVFKKIHNLDY